MSAKAAQRQKQKMIVVMNHTMESETIRGNRASGSAAARAWKRTSPVRNPSVERVIPGQSISIDINSIVRSIATHKEHLADIISDQPKRIYVCDHPGCERQFVRQDLCTRHKERHTARGSHLQRKDNALRGAPDSLPQHAVARSQDGSSTLPATTACHLLNLRMPMLIR